MNKLFPFIFILFSFCAEKKQVIVVSNTTEVDQEFKEVIISRNDIKQKGEPLPVIYDGAVLLPSQLEDMNNDGKWDNLVFQISVPSKSQKELLIDWVEKENYPTFEKNTQVYMGYSESRNGEFVSVESHVRPADHVAQSTPYLYQFEGPGWENNMIGFRSYFDSRNGKDIFGKTTSELVLHNVRTGENYHELQSWGMDILKVGNSLGAGALALLKNDSTIRLGETEYAAFEKIVEGPVRSIFKLSYKGWNVLGEEYELVDQITIYANKRWYKSQVFVPGHETDTLVTGIVNLKNATVEQHTEAQFDVLMTHGKQSANEDYLGMALLIPSTSKVAFSKSPSKSDGIVSTEIAKLKAANGQHEYYFYAGWELENSIFADRVQFQKEIRKAAISISSSIEVDIR